MRTGLLDSVKHVTIAPADLPEPGPDEVRIQVAFAGVCGSDLHAYKGLHPFRKPPVVLGHEVSGTVDRVGSAVSTLSPGDRVTVMPAVGCGSCDLCRQGRTNICATKSVPGTPGWLGTFAEYFTAPAAVTYRLPEGMSLEAAALAEPLATAVHSVRTAAVQSGDRVLVLGGGTIGMLAVYAATQHGAEAVAITDVVDFNLAMARDTFGAVPFNAADPEMEAAILDRFPERFDAVILCASVAATLHQSVRLVRRGGRIVVTGMYLEPVPFTFLDLTLGELVMAGSQIYTDADFREALAMLHRDPQLLTAIITHKMSLDQADAALTILATQAEPAVKILLEP
ncbi:MAG: alcohol dehydrogenase catalytic domain-containing protein [Planctomycetes bacterium]|nr:alcohol dehydrogenase catalytic domain-containing protein [Planctomycetota bacterium]